MTCRVHVLVLLLSAALTATAARAASPLGRKVEDFSLHDFRGKPVRTIVRGRTVYKDGKVIGEKGWGKQALARYAS